MVQFAQVLDIGLYIGAYGKQRRRYGRARPGRKIQSLRVQRADDPVAPRRVARLQVKLRGQRGLVRQLRARPGAAQHQRRARRQVGHHVQHQIRTGAVHLRLNAVERSGGVGAQHDKARGRGRAHRRRRGLRFVLVALVALRGVGGGLGRRCRLDGICALRALAPRIRRTRACALRGVLGLGRFSLFYRFAGLGAGLPLPRHRPEHAAQPVGLAQGGIGSRAARRHVQARRERPRVGQVLQLRLARHIGLAHFVSDPQAGDTQLRALLARGERGAQVVQRDGQRLAILGELEIAQRQPVHGDGHRQLGQGEGSAVVFGRRRLGRGHHVHAHRTGRQIAHVQQPVAQGAPMHGQVQIMDIDVRAAGRQRQLAHGHPAQERAIHVQRLAVQLLRGRRQQEARAVLRGHEPEDESGRQRGQHGKPGQPPHQHMAQEFTHELQNAIPNEKCRRRSRSRWP